MDGLITDLSEAPRTRGPGDRAAARQAVARVRAMAARRRASRRIYLVAPLQWKSARTAAQVQAADWSAAVSAPPCAWSGGRPRPSPAAKPAAHSLRWRALRVWTEARLLALRPLLLVARRGMRQAGHAAVHRLRSLHWPAWRAGAVRPGLAALSLGLAGAVLAGIMVWTRPAPLPSLSPVPRNAVTIARPRPAPAPAPVAAVPPSPTPASSPPATTLQVPMPLPVAAPPPDPTLAVLSEAGSMNLLAPAAEPDLDIASERSLWAQVGRRAGVDPLLLYSVALVESRSLHPDGQVGPTPWLFRVNDRLVSGRRHHVLLEMAVASQLGSAVQDVGIMQVYYPMHRDAVPNPLALLDPRTNITVAAGILRAGMRETRDPVLGVGYYHSHTPELARDYGTAVMTVYQRLKHLYPAGKSSRIVAR